MQAAPTVAETRFLLALAHEHAFIAGVVGWVDFESADVADTIAGACRRIRKLVGLRPMIQDIPDPEWMLDTGLAPAFEAMIDHGLVFDALVLPKHLPALLELAARYPDLAMVLDHGAKPPLAAGDLDEWKQGDRRARARNAHGLQTLGPGHRSRQRAIPACCAPAVDHLLESFRRRSA